METKFDFLATPTQAVNEVTNYINAIDERLLAVDKALEPIRNAADSLRDMLEDSMIYVAAPLRNTRILRNRSSNCSTPALTFTLGSACTWNSWQAPLRLPPWGGEKLNPLDFYRSVFDLKIIKKLIQKISVAALQNWA